MKPIRTDLSKKRISYNHCGLCGRQPKNHLEEPNYAPIRWWDADDGWKITTLCSWCVREVEDQQPKETDYAYRKHRTDVCSDEPDTDEDPMLALD